MLHGLETIAGKGWVFNGLGMDSYLVEYQRKQTCYSHDTLSDIIALDETAASITARKLLEKAREMLGPQTELELARDVLEKLVCPSCKREEQLFASLGRVPATKAICPNCSTARDVVTFYKIRGNEEFLDRPLASIGVPRFDIIIARAGDRSIGFELTGDAKLVLGPLIDNLQLEWS
jgi:adenylyltransferase/sulfurtransferase